MILSHIDQQLYGHSQRVILDNQRDGGYLACPNMPDYYFSWFRDGSFIAYALTLEGSLNGGDHLGRANRLWESVSQFHDWCANQINARTAQVESAIAQAQRGEPVDPNNVLHARYQIDGEAGPQDWPEFQLDGPGLWLWALSEYAERARLLPVLPVAWEHAVRLTARYLAAMWRTPCYDCWEERGSEVHISTLTAIYTGLQAVSRLLPDLDYTPTLDAIRTFIMQQGITPQGELAKSVGVDMVDANLLLAALPQGFLAPDDPLMQQTIARIERDLAVPHSGIYRHREDTYYGGGPWVLLALWLAWHYLRVGQRERASQLMAWAVGQADAEGNLPEQVNEHLLAPDYYEFWVHKRGLIANPLLWTHAMYLLVRRYLL